MGRSRRLHSIRRRDPEGCSDSPARIGRVPQVHPALPISRRQLLLSFAALAAGAAVGPPAACAEAFRHVPYKGGSQAMVDLLSGRVSAYYSTPSTAAPHGQAGKLVALATTGIERPSFQADIPTSPNPASPISTRPTGMQRGAGAHTGADPEALERGAGEGAAGAERTRAC